MVYKWNIPNVPVDAQAAGEFFADIEKRHGVLKPAVVVDESRAEDALLHNCFEWDDTKAAELFREGQAGYLIRNIRVIIEVDTPRLQPPVRAFVNVTQDDKPRGYIAVQTALQSKPLRAQLLRNALNDLLAFQYKYEALTELSGVFEAINKFTETFNTKEENSK